MAIAGPASTKPEAGVMATSPATAPAPTPNTLAFFVCHQLNSIQVRAAAAAATCVTTKALIARPFAARALPALKPNQPNQRRATPNIIIETSGGSTASFPY